MRILRTIFIDYKYIISGWRFYIFLFCTGLFIWMLTSDNSHYDDLYRNIFEIILPCYVVFIIGVIGCNEMNVKLKILLPLSRFEHFIVSIAKPFIVLMFSYTIIALLYWNTSSLNSEFNYGIRFPLEENLYFYLLALPSTYMIYALGPRIISLAFILYLIYLGLNHFNVQIDYLAVLSVLSHPLISIPLTGCIIYLIYKETMATHDYGEVDYEDDDEEVEGYDEYDEKFDCN